MKRPELIKSDVRLCAEAAGPSRGRAYCNGAVVPVTTDWGKVTCLLCLDLMRRAISRPAKRPDLVCVCGRDRAVHDTLDCGPEQAPRKRPAPKSAEELAAIRAAAWKTRRAMYGERGHR